jgi:1-acyl-sn-glycerol-3-phosphate acyltransferase
MTTFFLSVYDYFAPRKKQLFGLLTLLLVMFAFLTTQTRFREDISGFLPETKENQLINNAYRYVVSANKITVYCSAPDSSGQHADDQIEAIEQLAGYLQALKPTYIKSLTYKTDPTEIRRLTTFIVNNIPYFLDEIDYQRIETLLTKEAIAARLKANHEQLLSPIGMVFKHNILSDPLGIAHPVLAKLQDFQVSDRFQMYQDYIFTDDDKAFLLIECTMPVSETNKNAALLDSLNLYIHHVEQAMDGKITFQHFGASEIALTNASRIKKDTLLSVIISLILISAILIYSYRSGRRIFLIFFAVLFGGLFAMALLYLISGEVSIIAIGISSIMFGIAVNYPLHFIDHHNYVPHPRMVIKDIIEPLTIGNITTVGAFLSLLFIGSDAMSDLGLFASLLLIGTILFVLFFIPHLLPSGQIAFYQPRPSLFSRFIGKPFEKNRWLVLSVLLLTVVLGFFSTHTHFETNMQNINYMTDSQQEEYRRMMDLLNENRHVMYFVSEGENLNRALETNESMIPKLNQLIDKGILTKSVSIHTFFPSLTLQAERIARWNTFWSTRKDSVMLLLTSESIGAGFTPALSRQFQEMLNHKWEIADLSFFTPIKETLIKNQIIETPEKSLIINLLYTDASQAAWLEAELNGLNPSSVAFDSGSLTRRMVESLSGNFDYVLYVCGLIVFAFLLFSFGRLELTLIAFLPLVLSWIWILGLMNIFDIRFNIVNIILATFIFGQGDDYTIFMTEGLMYEYTYKRKILFSYKNSIALSALIMFIGIGSLIFAKHPALRSLAEVTIVGMSSVIMMAYIFPSLLFHALTTRKGNKRLMPVTLKNFFTTLLAFVYFLIFSLLITIAGWILFTFGRTTEKKKLTYHRLLQRIAHFTIFHIPQVKTTCENLSNETFDKPGIIICNHQSHLDLMCIMMLTPKLVILTNDWVWNSPFYGRLIRYADFYPISDGFTNALAPLREIVQRGYSIVTFPEGTRSPDCSIQRFRKGAFFLAEQLQLDIIPVMIHGVGHVLPKKELMLRKGNIHIRVMERISLNDSRFSDEYAHRTKEMRWFYREQYQTLCRQLETPDYYSDLVIHNYIYKGASIERAVRKNLRRTGNFNSIIHQLPDEGKIVVRNYDYGEFALLLALVKKQLQVIVFEKNTDILDLAVNCASLPSNLIYTDNEQFVLANKTDDCILIENNIFTWLNI